MGSDLFPQPPPTAQHSAEQEGSAQDRLLQDRLEQRLVELEMRLTFQEQAMAELSQALADARLQSDRNASVLMNLLADLRKLRGELYVDPADEPPPPHY